MTKSSKALGFLASLQRRCSILVSHIMGHNPPPPVLTWDGVPSSWPGMGIVPPPFLTWDPLSPGPPSRVRMGGGGPPSQVRSVLGVPPVNRMRYPPPPPPQLAGWGTPPPIRVQVRLGGGGTPNWNSTTCTCYVAGGVPHAFTQEDFLVSSRIEIREIRLLS